LNIRTRIALWLCAVGLGATLILSGLVFFQLAEKLYEVIDSDLTHLAADCREIARQSLSIRDFSAHMDAAPTARHNLIAIFERSGRPVWRSDLATSASVVKPEVDGHYNIETTQSAHRVLPEAEPEDRLGFRILATDLIVAGEAHTLVVGKPVESLHAEMLELGLVFASGLTVALALVIAASYAIAGKILRPIATINQLADNINENTLAQRIPLPKSKDELFRLTRRLNAMFDRLEHSFDRQKQFTAAASHELKTPLAQLRLQTEEILQEESLTEDIRLAVARQSEILQRACRLTRDLLDLSALELQDNLVREPIWIDRLLQVSLEDFEELLAHEGLVVSTAVTPGLVVKADPEKMQRVFVNLLDNAIKYNVPGGRLALSADRNERWVTVRIRNSGSGIPPDDLPQVFDQFYRVEKSRSAKYGGVGLGLTIVRTVVQRHGGTVVIDSDGISWVEATVSLPSEAGQPRGNGKKAGSEYTLTHT
jgi:two-component system OmpR family sensor kinase